MASMQQVVRRLSIEATTRGVREAEQAVKGLSGSLDGVAASSQRAERATQSMESRLGSIQRKYDEQYRAQQAQAKVERDLMQAQAQGLVSQQRRLELLSLAAERHGLATAAINREKAATDALAASQMRQANAANDNFRRRNLQFQLFDVGTGLAGGMNPALVAMQQGPQIVQMYAGAGGVNAALRDTVGLLTTVARGFGPVAVAAGVGALAISGMRSEIQETTGVAVTFGDVFKGVFQVIGRGIYDFLKPAIDALAPWFEWAWEKVKNITTSVFNAIIRGGAYTIETIKFLAGSLPDAFRAAGEFAANAWLTSMEQLARETLVGINDLLTDINGMLPQNLQIPLAPAPMSVSFGRVDIGGVEAFERLVEASGNYQTNMERIAATDYTGKFFDAVSDAAVANHKAAAEAEKNAAATGKAGDAAGKAKDAWKGLREETNGGSDSFRRAASEAERAAAQINGTLGQALNGLFDKPFKDADEFFDQLMRNFASIGQQFMNFGLTGDWASPGADNAANQNGAAKAGEAIKKGAFEGTAAGLITVFKSLGMSDKGATAAAGGLSGVVGAFGVGYQTKSPVMGGIGGALSGLGAGASIGSALGIAGMLIPGIGAIVGAIAGVAGAIFGASQERKKERAEAQAQLKTQNAAVTQILQVGAGKGVGEFQKQFMEFEDAGNKLQSLARKAGDPRASEIGDAIDNTFAILNREFLGRFEGFNQALRDGLGKNSPFEQGRTAVLGLRDELKNWIADVEYMSQKSAAGDAETQRRIAETQAAAQAMAIASLTGAKELSAVESEILRLQGAAVGLQSTLEQLGMSSDEAAAAIADGLGKAMDKLRADFMGGVDRRFYEANGQSYLNDLLDLANQTKAALDDSAALGGLGMERIRETFRLSAQSIANDSNLSAAQVAEANRVLADALAAIGMTIPNAVGQVTTALFDRAGLQSKLNDASGKGYLNQFGSLRTEVTGLMGQTNSLADIGLISQYSAAAARQIAESSGLSSEAIRGLATTFPLFGQTLLRVADDMDKAAEQAQRAEEASAAAAAAAARRAAILGLQPGLLERTQGQAAAQDWQLSQLAVGNVGLSGIRNAGSVDAARAQLELFINTIKRTGQSADDISQAGQLAYQVFDQVVQSLQTAQSEADRLAESFQSMAESVSDSLTSFADRATSELESTFNRAIDAYRSQYSDLVDAITGARSYLDSIATLSTNPQTQFEIMQQRFRDAASAASGGSAEALRGLTGQAGSYLDAAAQFFPAGTQQYFQAVEEVRAALGTGIGAAQDRANSVQGQIERLNTLMEAQTRAIQDTVGRLIEQVKTMGLGQNMLLGQIAKILEQDKPAADLLRAVQALIAATKENGDQLGAIAKKKAA